jgi:hypothetical protein
MITTVKNIKRDYIDVNEFKFADAFLFLHKENREINKDDLINKTIINDNDLICYVNEEKINFVCEVLNPVFCSPNEFPIKGDYVLYETSEGEYNIEITKKNLNNKDLYNESTRVAFKVLFIEQETLLHEEYKDKIVRKEWEEGGLFKIEVENKVYNEKDNKEVDYIFYDSYKSVFKLKNPINIIKNNYL